VRIKATPREAERILALRIELMKGNAEKALKSLVREGKKAARDLSSGPYLQRDLTRLGHPYAKRRPNPPLPASIINKQTGVFRRSWKTDEPQIQGRNMVGRLFNNAPHALFLLGGPRSKMIPRPIVLAITNHLRDHAMRMVKNAVKRALIEGR
jgi:hypothetical protein